MKSKKTTERTAKKPKRKVSTAAKLSKTAPAKAVSKAKKPTVRKKAALKKPKISPRTRKAANKPKTGSLEVAEVLQTMEKLETPEVEKTPVVEKKPELTRIEMQPEKKRIPKLARPTPLKIPPILLEGDKPEPIAASGPGERFSLGPKPPIEKLETEGELPEAYGTQRLILTARDPHWLYAHWDLNREQQRKYNAYSRDGHLILRVYADSIGGKPEVEIHLQPESNHWFVPVERAGNRYVAELGYYSAADKWTIVATSGATMTPPDKMSEETDVEFTTIPLEIPLEKLFTLVKEAVQEYPPLAQAAMRELREEHPRLPQMTASEQPKETARTTSAPVEITPTAAAPAKRKLATRKVTPPQWTPAQEKALAEIISMDHVRRVWMGSLEITELIRRQFMKELTSQAEAQLGAGPGGVPTSFAQAPGVLEEVPGAVSSPTMKAEKRGKGFWFNVNAELIIYGATEADATVTIAGRKIKLRRDGSFSYRFALPDGNYDLPVVAVSADQTDGRAAKLQFSRTTEYRGDVGQHPQDEALKKPVAESF